MGFESSVPASDRVKASTEQRVPAPPVPAAALSAQPLSLYVLDVVADIVHGAVVISSSGYTERC